MVCSVGQSVHVAVKCVLLWLYVTGSVTGAKKRVFRKKIQISAENPYSDVIGLPKIEHDGWVDPCFYPTMESVLTVWEKSEAQFKKAVKSFVSMFKVKCFPSPPTWDDKNAGQNRKPFINIEGFDQKKRDTVAKNVVKKIKGQFLTNPPRCLVLVQYIYGGRQHELYRPYMALSNYGSSHTAKANWISKPVVITKYWYDLQATTLTDLFWYNATPPLNTSLYAFPKDLNKPDLTIFISSKDSKLSDFEDVKPEDRIGSPAWVSRYSNIFLTFPNANIHEVNWTEEENVTETIVQLIKDKLTMPFQLSL